VRFPLFFKAVSIGFVLFLMSLVLMRIGFLVDERAARQREAVASVEQSHAGAQTLLGPLLQRHCVEEWEVVTGEGKDRKVSSERRAFLLTAVPATLDVQGQTRADLRRRGLFKVHSYGAQLTLDAAWTDRAALQPRRQQANSRLQCDEPVLNLALSDVRGVRAAKVELDGRPLAVRPGTGDARRPRGLHAVLDEAGAPEASTMGGIPVDATASGGRGRPLQPPGGAAGAGLKARVVLELAGTGQLALVPAADTTRFNLQSDWPHPSFGGRFLPTAHDITKAGFSARWAVSSLASDAPAQLQRVGGLCPGAEAGRAAISAVVPTMEPTTHGCLDTLQVAFFDPVNPHVLSDRAIKYGLLFVVLTFVAVALVEVLSGHRVHPVQYLLVGLALSLFFLLLLSLSEHWPFAFAYLAAACACALLLGYYAAHMLGRARAGVAFGASIAGLYGLLYALLQMEQNALVIGSVGLFAAVAVVMVLTRRIDWYAFFDGLRRGNLPPQPEPRTTAAAEIGA
jgi:inner membrane protein